MGEGGGGSGGGSEEGTLWADCIMPEELLPVTVPGTILVVEIEGGGIFVVVIIDEDACDTAVVGICIDNGRCVLATRVGCNESGRDTDFTAGGGGKGGGIKPGAAGPKTADEIGADVDADAVGFVDGFSTVCWLAAGVYVEASGTICVSGVLTTSSN